MFYPTKNDHGLDVVLSSVDLRSLSSQAQELTSNPLVDFCGFQDIAILGAALVVGLEQP